MLTKSELLKLLKTKNPDAVLFDERAFPAFIGIGYSGINLPIAVYSKQILLDILRDRGMPEDDVLDYYNWHFSGLHAGVNTPVIFDDIIGVA